MTGLFGNCFILCVIGSHSFSAFSSYIRIGFISKVVKLAAVAVSPPSGVAFDIITWELKIFYLSLFCLWEIRNYV